MNNTSVDHLLVPTYEVIADYPFSQWHIGNVIMQEHDPQVSLESYPHLFKKLEWWEHRKPEEMPEYVKWTYPGTKEISFLQVEQWLRNSCGVYTAGTKDAYLLIKDIRPATKSEYDEYLKTISNVK